MSEIDYKESDEILDVPAKKERKPRTPREGIKESKKEKLTANQITGLLMLSLNGAANVANVPEMGVEETEAREIAQAIVDLLQHYDFKTSAKAMAWANLVGVLATVYGLKIFALFNKNND